VLTNHAGHVTSGNVTDVDMIFGGQATRYSCSTSPGSIDHRASVDGWGDESHCDAEFVAEDYKLGTTYDCGSQRCSYSAYVADHCFSTVNHCWK